MYNSHNSGISSCSQSADYRYGNYALRTRTLPADERRRGGAGRFRSRSEQNNNNNNK